MMIADLRRGWSRPSSIFAYFVVPTGRHPASLRRTRGNSVGVVGRWGDLFGDDVGERQLVAVDFHWLAGPRRGVLGADVAQAVAELVGTVVGKGDPCWPLQVEIARGVLALDGTPADELAEWVAVLRPEPKRPLGEP
jgi:hypothetical protein